MWIVLLLDDYRIDDIILLLLTQGQGQGLRSFMLKFLSFYAGHVILLQNKKLFVIAPLID